MTIVCQYQYKVHAKVTVYLLIIDHYLWCKQSLHYREVVMKRWKFEYAAIQRKMPLSLFNFQPLAPNFRAPFGQIEAVELRPGLIFNELMTLVHKIVTQSLPYHVE